VIDGGRKRRTDVRLLAAIARKIDSDDADGGGIGGERIPDGLFKTEVFRLLAGYVFRDIDVSTPITTLKP